MSNYRTTKELDLVSIDREILKLWEKQKIFQKSVEQRASSPPYVFFEGPPSANGKPGIHHVMARTVKDLFCRYHTMKSKKVIRKGGWDTHGLPVELAVEKELGITKDDIGKKISIEEFNLKCRETVMRYKDLWDKLTVEMGYWVDLQNPYMTLDNDYIESVWYLLKEIYDKGLLYKGYTIQPYSPAAGTGLSTHELNMPGAYRDVKDTSVVAQFKIAENEKSEFLYEKVENGPVYFLAWTTTPWTLPSNVALAVGRQIKYALVATYNPYTYQRVNLILAEDLIARWFDLKDGSFDLDSYNSGDKDIPNKVLDVFQGEKFEWLNYEQLLPYVQPEDGDAFKVLLGDFVSTEDGTGIVHIAPSFGSDDMMIAKKYGMGSLTLVDSQGKFVDEVTDFAGRYVKDYKDEGEDYRSVDVDIAIKLKEENKAFNVQKYSHNYPHCWRTDKPVLYYPLDSWFIKASARQKQMVELNKTINWKPGHTGEKRFGNWLENVQDWNLSRSRFWGIPLPIWRTEDGKEQKCIGSVAQLKEEIEEANRRLGLSQVVPGDLHRPYIDEIFLVSDSGLSMKRELDLIDVWFDSGAMPFAQWHYPFENRELIDDNKFYPADFISEGVDQTRGWFYTLHAISTLVKDSVAFKNVVSTGLVLDKDGVKMSKRLGNVIDPFEAISTYGADANRWYMIANAPPWDNLKFDLDNVDDVRKKFFGTLYNTYSFFALYANIDGFDFSEDYIPVSERPELDRWIMSLLNSLINYSDDQYAQYEPTNAARQIQHFVNEQLSNWYVRLSRRRFWKGDYSADKISAYQTLYECLVSISRMMAPVSPFFSEWLFRNLNEVSKREEADSVHLCFYPAADHQVIDRQLEEKMEYAQIISSLVLSLRKKAEIRVRQPLSKILIPILDEVFEKQVRAVEPLILAETNVKKIEYVTDASGIIKKKIKPNYRTLGKMLGKRMKEAASIISSFNQETINRIEKSGSYELRLNGEIYHLTSDDFEINSEDIPGWQVASDGNITVALDLQLTEELLDEGTARELVNRIQNIRKQKDFDVTDQIVVNVQDHEIIKSALNKFSNYIASEVLAKEINISSKVAGEEVQLVDDILIQIDVTKFR